MDNNITKIIVNKMVKKTECPICFEDICGNKNRTTTECGHTFHSSCIFTPFII